MSQVSTGDATQDVIPVFTKQKRKKLPKALKIVIILIVIAAVVGGIAYGVWQVFREKPKEIETATAQISTLTNTVSGSGTATPRKSADIVGSASGRVQAVNVAVGDRVNEGDLLMVIDDSALVTKRTDAQDTYNEALKSVNENNKKIAALTVRAPISGRIIDFDVQPGSEQSEGTAVATIVDDSALKLVLYYSTRYENMVYVGQSANVFVPQTMANVSGTVSEIVKMNKVSAEGAVLFQVTIKVPNPGALADGMTASASMNAQETIMPYDSGKLEYWQSKAVLPEASGNVTKVYVSNYTSVSAGQALFTMENSDYADVAKSLSKTLETAQTALDDVNDELKNYQITSPITGTVLAVNVNIDDELEGGSNVLISVADIDKMTIEAQIDELDVGKLQSGMMATINIDTDTGTDTYIGTLTSVGLQGKVQNGYTYYPGIIEFEGSENLRSGMWVNFEIQTSVADNVLVVPQRAVNYTESGTVCFIRDNGEKPENFVELEGVSVPEGFIAVNVETGASDVSNIEIVSGLEEGTEVALGEKQDENSGGVMGVG